MSTKGNVLKTLEENKGATISGEELASRLNLSRAAIWKAIQELRKEGYSINAITNKGYSLSNSSDLLSSEGILPYITTSDMDGKIHVFKTVESTNLTAKKMALDGAPSGTVVISEEQTQGRGRMGRNFYSPSQSGIYMSIILEPKFQVSKSVLITTAASVAVCNAIEKVTGISCKIKWVNDIYIKNKKVCGILTEAVSDFETGHIDYIILGIGINFSTASAEFPEEIKNIATSLYEDGLSQDSNDAPKDISRNHLIAEIINQVIEVNDEIESRNFIDDYKKRSFVLGHEIRILPTGISEKERDFAEGIIATAIDIDADGGLVVRYDDGQIQSLHSGEISIRLAQ